MVVNSFRLVCPYRVSRKGVPARHMLVEGLHWRNGSCGFTERRTQGQKYRGDMRSGGGARCRDRRLLPDQGFQRRLVFPVPIVGREGADA